MASGVSAEGCAVIGFVAAQFQDLQLFITEHRGRTDAEANAAGFEYLSDASHGGENTWMAPPANPARMPFFTFWVFYTHDVVSAGSAVGLGEVKDAVQPSGVTSTKDIAYPVRLLPPLLNDLGNLGTAEQRDLHVAEGLAGLGGAGERLDAARSRLDGDLLTIRENLSSLEDADLAGAVVNLEMQQAAYEAALAALRSIDFASMASFLG